MWLSLNVLSNSNRSKADATEKRVLDLRKGENESPIKQEEMKTGGSCTRLSAGTRLFPDCYQDPRG